MSENIGRQVSFHQLITDFGRVQIPIIQRDYAQGRPEHSDLRGTFLDALRRVLITQDAAPLNLDFVYGSGSPTDHKDAQGNAGTGFAPLDGQQRLTTLFLLHWYLAWLDGKTADFRAHFSAPATKKSRFTYEVRPSSIDFFDALVQHFPESAPPPHSQVRTVLEDSTWFFRSWRRDPTIDAALNTLDDIHARFHGCPAGCYSLLVDATQPRIAFQLLPLEGFGLSDDLYVKMNARGKPLTSFESLKAQLLKRLPELSLNQSWDLDRFDGVWLDLFWNHTRRPRPGMKWEMDDAMMRLIKAVALTSLDPEAAKITKWVTDLKKEPADQLTLQKLDELGGITPQLVQTLFHLLDNWVLLDEHRWNGIGRKQFEMVTAPRDPAYPDLVVFAAFGAFCRSHSLFSDIDMLDEWMRVVQNLTRNSDIKSPHEFAGALKAIRILEPHLSTVLNHLPTATDLPVFNKQQQREERVKAALIIRDAEWRKLVREAEDHGYFQGQIEFLLSFSGIMARWGGGRFSWTTKVEEESRRDAFRRYFALASTVFGPGGLRDDLPDFKWERALLCKGDYTLRWGYHNVSLLQNGAGNHDLPTWKDLLRGGAYNNPALDKRRELVKALLDSLSPCMSVEASLDAVLAESQIDERWRAMLVERSELMAYCRNKMLRHLVDGSIYLISSLRTSSDHVELWSYHLYLTRLKDQDFRPWTVSYSSSNREEILPCINLHWPEQSIVAELDFDDHHFRLAFRPTDKPCRDYLLDTFKHLFKVQPGAIWTSVIIPHKDIDQVLRLLQEASNSYIIS